MSSVTSPATVRVGAAEVGRLRRRVLALGRMAIEGPRDPSDLLGAALSELRAMLSCVQSLQSELERQEEAFSVLTAAGPAPPTAHREPQRQRPAADALLAAERSSDQVDLFGEPLDAAPDLMEAALRARITGALCLGTRRPGDHLPGVREFARRTGLNHKVVRRVIRALEQSGLVEVRDRSGIYAAEPHSSLAEDWEERDGWVARFLVEATEHGVGAGELPSLLWQWTAARPLRCACLESTEDDRFALCREIAERFGVETVPVDAASDGAASALQEADLVVTTPFHAAEARAALAPGQPLVVNRLHSHYHEAMRRGGSASPCVLICVDRASGERLLHGLDAHSVGRVQVLGVEEIAGAAPLPECEAGIATLAAWERLGAGDPPPHLTVPRYLSAPALQEIAGLLVRLNRAAAPT